MKEYDFVCENGFYTINRTGYSHVGVFGVGHKDRGIALKQAKNYCRNSFAKLNIIA